MKKSEIIEALIKEQEKVMLELGKAKEIYKNSSDIDEEDTIDPDDLSHQSEAKEMQLNIESKIRRQNNVVEKLGQFKNQEISNVQEGALVETDKMYIYVGVVAHTVEINDKKVLSISQKAPILEQLKKMNVGDEINIGNVTHTILHIG